jgi:hypothetical protein
MSFSLEKELRLRIIFAGEKTFSPVEPQGCLSFRILGVETSSLIRVKFARFCEQLTIGQTVFIRDQRADDALGQIRVMKFQKRVSFVFTRPSSSPI